MQEIELYGSQLEINEENDDGVIDGEWSCYECDTQNEICDGQVISYDDIVECENCGEIYKLI